MRIGQGIPDIGYMQTFELLWLKVSSLGQRAAYAVLTGVKN